MVTNKIDPNQSGVLLLDKPKGMTSNRAIQTIKKHFGLNKVGHTGTLDPMATGMLPICLNETTKLAKYLLSDSKTYRFTLAMGKQTDTGDADGCVIAQSDVPILEKATIDHVLRSFIGESQQVPPMYSALKYQGKPLYAYARQGQEIKRSSRSILIYDIKLIESQRESITVEVKSSTGTYIRVLAENIAEKLHAIGHLSALRRVHVSCFEQKSMIKLDRLLEADFPIEQQIISHHNLQVGLPKIEVNKSVRDRLLQGQRILTSDADFPDDLREYAIYSRDLLIGIGIVSLSKNGNNILKIKRVIR